MRMRKKKNGFNRFTALSSIIIHNAEELYVNPMKPFISDKPLRLEIGCGKGDFIIGTSNTDSEYNYYAMEKITDVIIIAAEKYSETKGFGERDKSGKFNLSEKYKVEDNCVIPKETCGNVRFINEDATNLEDYFPENTFSTIYLNFSDPWSKKGYAKRRLTHINFLKKYSSLLIPGGELKIKTDNTNLFNFTLEQIQTSQFSIIWQTNDLHTSEKASENIMTEYERNFSNQGIKINSLTAINKK